MKYGFIPRFSASFSSLTHVFQQQKCTYPPAEINYLFNQSNTSAISTALQHYINSDHPSHGQKVHSHILKTGFRPNTSISIKLLIVHVKSSCLLYARKVFDELSQPTLSAYNYLLSGYVKSGNVSEAFSLVRRLCFSGECPDGFTFSMLLKASTSDSVLAMPRSVGSQVHAQIVKSDTEADDVLYTALVYSYVKSGRVNYARRVFDLMMEKNVVCSTCMISGYMEQGCVEEAEEIFKKTVEKDVVVYNAMIEGYSKSVETSKRAIDVFIDMQRMDYRPTISTFASIFGACSILSAVEVGQQVQGQLTKTKFFNDIKMGSALLDMYSKCGRVEDARRVFDFMPVRNVFSWTSMIDGYGKNGNPAEALELFSILQRSHSVEPNYVTFLSALSACGHAGFVAKGKQIFDSMKTYYSMKPRMEHYACMVDLLGRAGSLNQALEFIMDMPETPNSDVWAALLSSSRLHDDVEMANIAANELFKLGSDSRPGAYIAFSNTLAAAERWDTVSEIREVMKARGISKNTGFSWVGADGNLEGFHAGQKM
ncbi:hypothetical protein DCAR_0209008 [Daucus carota subsp. sativus]|uniref:Pentacotripeptide-repeat region of PRORP domain-containing protein n=1 Tax=Daucus carota subsp. sativus TaxID=79200 RepID=A0A166EYJ0_DAUCS|nr:PREDICTED: pentatricopeptide repeat-containing protein At1g28690, mitochondrial [Daucus carota subsp. sativus]WOG89769.1 hypothetical protein DCAR_0209008 [Daucus carota subsp. sativus]